MKTGTQSQLIQLIKRLGPSRPLALATALKISPQALHRHLKTLVEGGILEKRGHPPSTEYVISGGADFSDTFAWLHSKGSPIIGAEQLCETRDVFLARLSSLRNLVKQGLPLSELPMLISIVGEIGNNSFDHNLGQWRDVPGCCLNSQVSGSRLWICIADRGRGIFKSLRRVVPLLKNDQEALEMAFEKQISGRAPEQRGNGLKFVRTGILEKSASGLACISGRGIIMLGDRGSDCQSVLKEIKLPVQGTVTLLQWGLG